MRVISVDFIGAAARPGVFPEHDFPEIAFAGRSNVGKSSLINRLLERKIARTSNTPGRTRQINFFVVNRQLTIVDLPGFGYARVSKSERGQWKQLVEDYLIHSRHLCGVVVIVDIRRGPEAEEQTLGQFLTHHGRPFIVVATKSDKLKRAQCERRQKELESRLRGQIVLFSAQTGTGSQELWEKLERLSGYRPDRPGESSGNEHGFSRYPNL